METPQELEPPPAWTLHEGHNICLCNDGETAYCYDEDVYYPVPEPACTFFTVSVPHGK